MTLMTTCGGCGAALTFSRERATGLCMACLYDTRVATRPDAQLREAMARVAEAGVRRAMAAEAHEQRQQQQVTEPDARRRNEAH